MKSKRLTKEKTAADLRISQMPTLRHSMPGEPFDIRRSKVAQWLCSQPEVMQWVFDTANHRGLIVYDAESGTWHGADYEG